jgi:uncharacterized protein YceK
VGHYVEGIKVRKSRYIFTALMIISIIATLLLAGCASKSNSTSTPARKYDIVKVIDLVDSKGANWKVYQLRLDLEGGASFTIDLNLSDGDKVDCYYKLEKPTTGGNIDFKVKAGTAIIYNSAAVPATAVANTSDRLTFSAAPAQGTSYRLIFKNNLVDKTSKQTIFTEIIYPAKISGEDSIFIPLETN